jgi:hypothetical protein
MFMRTYMLNVAPSPMTCGKEVATEAYIIIGNIRIGTGIMIYSHFPRNGLPVSLPLRVVPQTTIDKQVS